MEFDGDAVVRLLVALVDRARSSAPNARSPTSPPVCGPTSPSAWGPPFSA